MNKLYFGDNLDWLRSGKIAPESVDLIYLDPPFNSQAAYNVLYKSPIGGDAQVRAFEDTWSWEKDGAAKALDDLAASDVTTFNMLRALQVYLGRSDLMAYLAMMAVRLVELKRVLKPAGSIYLHCDPTACHYLKIVMDAIFGADAFVNQITWKRSHAHNDGKQGSKHYGRNSDTILFYSRSPKRTWNPQYGPYSEDYIASEYWREEPDGRRYRISDMRGPGGAAKGNPFYEVMGVSRYWAYSKASMDRMITEGRVVQTRPGAVPQMKRYLDEMPGVTAQEIWTDIPVINNRSKEALPYPTQKPLALLERIIKASSNEGDLILDPFCGCGTAIHAADRLHRNWIGIDVTYLAIQVIQDRLKAWAKAAVFDIDGIPKDEMSARKLAADFPHRFQQWAVGRLGGQSRGPGADGGIDGELVFMTGKGDYARGIISVKGGRNVHVNAVRELRSVVDSQGAAMGVFVCLDPTSNMRGEANDSGLVELPGGKRTKIQIVTARELVEEPNLGIPTVLNTITSAQHARAVARRQPPSRPTAEQLRREPEFPPMPLKGGKTARAQPTLPLDEPLMTAAPPKGRRRR